MSEDHIKAPRPRKPRGPSLTRKQRHELVMAIIEADKTEPDRTLAEKLSARFGHPVQSATVAAYRTEFGIQSVKMPKARELAAELAEAKALLAQMKASGEIVTP